MCEALYMYVNVTCLGMVVWGELWSKDVCNVYVDMPGCSCEGHMWMGTDDVSCGYGCVQVQAGV